MTLEGRYAKGEEFKAMVELHNLIRIKLDRLWLVFPRLAWKNHKLEEYKARPNVVRWRIES